MKIFLYIAALTLCAFFNCKKKSLTEEPVPPPAKRVFESAAVINTKLGRGINYSGIFESSSGAGQGWYPGFARSIANVGFKHVRIPVRWERADRSLEVPPYTINGEFIHKVKQAVDSALANGLYVVLNMHNHLALMNDPDGQKDRFLAQWKQISVAFKDYPDSLVFEILNEPGVNMTYEKWNTFAALAVATIREDNPERSIMIDLSVKGLNHLFYLELPKDKNIILTPHYYAPFNLTHQGASWADPNTGKWAGTEWWDTEPERKALQRELEILKAFEAEHKVPVHIGEFGIINNADPLSREKWSGFLSRYFDAQGWSWAYFNFNVCCFGYLDPNAGSNFNAYLVDAVLKDEMPAPTPYTAIPLYHSDFSASTDGWLFGTTAPASGTLRQENNHLVVKINNGGTINWHAQLQRKPLNLVKGKKYHVSIKAKASNPHDFNVIFTQTVPPATYYYTSIVTRATLGTEFKYYDFVFDMYEESDNNARIALDMGNTDLFDGAGTEITIEEIRIDEMVKP